MLVMMTQMIESYDTRRERKDRVNAYSGSLGRKTTLFDIQVAFCNIPQCLGIEGCFPPSALLLAHRPFKLVNYEGMP